MPSRSEPPNGTVHCTPVWTGHRAGRRRRRKRRGWRRGRHQDDGRRARTRAFRRVVQDGPRVERDADGAVHVGAQCHRVATLRKHRHARRPTQAQVPVAAPRPLSQLENGAAHGQDGGHLCVCGRHGLCAVACQSVHCDNCIHALVRKHRNCALAPPQRARLC